MTLRLPPTRIPTSFNLLIDILLHLYYDLLMRKTMSRTDRQEKQGEQALYNRLAVLRAEHGLSRQQLAKALDINYQTVGYLERGEYNPSLELAFRIAALFDLPIEAIFARTPFTPMSAALYSRPSEQQRTGGDL